MRIITVKYKRRQFYFIVLSFVADRNVGYGPEGVDVDCTDTGAASLLPLGSDFDRSLADAVAVGGQSHVSVYVISRPALPQTQTERSELAVRHRRDLVAFKTAR